MKSKVTHLRRRWWIWDSEPGLSSTQPYVCNSCHLDFQPGAGLLTPEVWGGVGQGGLVGPVLSRGRERSYSLTSQAHCPDHCLSLIRESWAFENSREETPRPRDLSKAIWPGSDVGSGWNPCSLTPHMVLMLHCSP